MSPETPFKASDWIGQGNTMAAAPPRVHRAAKEHFAIPQEFYFDLLPSPMISIAKMVDFTVPLEAIPNGAIQPAQFFSQVAPDRVDKDTIFRLRRLPIPERKIIRKLATASRQAWLPLWVLTYWTWIIDFKRDVRDRWLTSSDWVAKHKKSYQKTPKLAALVNETSHILSVLPWGWAKPAGLSDAEPVHTLWRLLGPHWLADSQQNDMLELLRHKIDADPDLARKFRVQSIALAPKIIKAHNAGGEAYKTAREFRWIRDIADDLVRNQAALITSGHLGEISGEDHWIGLVFDLSHPTPKIRYGDGFKNHIPQELLTACRWWLAQHTALPALLEDLPIAEQTDGFSCGMLVDNCFQHLVDPEIRLSARGENFVPARLEVFNKIAKWALDRVCFPAQ
ncbi:hypothetical protein B0H16DRAFT_1516884 [Mycena metata]|uniref:Ubiquitin-like protease family profile domain-containing protein n=1 Tax=Mycena metata TaxID=1033252 RepID=A0AAD7NP70_9AGAR|nr:hypothetical protein B0H16DRAFT_1516884 [Mycena metata]